MQRLATYLLTGLLIFQLAAAAGATSLWTDDSQSMCRDTRARAVGDLLTVVITQQSIASTSAKHATSKGIDVSAEAGSGWFSRFSGLGTNGSRTTNGSGSSVADTRFLDRMTVTITEVLPNGILRIQGSRCMKMEQDELLLNFSGTIRPEDIQPDNTVSSTAVADLFIEAKGNGPIAEKQRTGIIGTLLSILW
jgi:flagellar L-ring protein precursor FlgH